ncbi:unnamed protein product [Calypogeia fissa]
MAAQYTFSPTFGAVVVVAFGLLLLPTTTTVSAATTYSIHWTIPLKLGSLGKSPVLEVGDTLHFHYHHKKHTVLEVTAEALKNCDDTAPIHKWADGDTKIKFDEAGSHHFMCDHPTHCLAKQKISVLVVESGSKAADPEHSGIAPGAHSTMAPAIAPAHSVEVPAPSAMAPAHSVEAPAESDTAPAPSTTQSEHHEN